MRKHTPLLVAAMLTLTVLPTFVDTARGEAAGVIALENGGKGPFFDPINHRGKLFPNAAEGTITKICAWGQTAGTSVDVAVKPAADSSTPSLTTTINIVVPSGWSCVDRSDPWSAPTLFIYKTGGDGSVGYDNDQPYDSRYSDNGGASWAPDPDGHRRGYRVEIFVTPSPPTPPGGGTQLANGGAGPSYDSIDFRGKYFPTAPRGTITQICAFAEAAATTLTVAIQPTPSGAATLTVAIPITAGADWNCQTVAVPWTSSSLFIYKLSGTAAVGYDSHTPHDSRWSNDGGLTWNSDNWRRGYSVFISH